LFDCRYGQLQQFRQDATRDYFVRREAAVRLAAASARLSHAAAAAADTHEAAAEREAAERGRAMPAIAVIGSDRLLAVHAAFAVVF